MTWVTPIVLLLMLYTWGKDVALEVLQFRDNPNGKPYTEAGKVGAYVGRTLMLVLFAFFAIMVWVAARRGRFKRVENLQTEESA
jgi:hypothetical protein